MGFKMGIFKDIYSAEREMACLKDLDKQYQEALRKMDFSKAKLIEVDKLRSLNELEKLSKPKRALSRWFLLERLKQQGVDAQVVRKINHER